MTELSEPFNKICQILLKDLAEVSKENNSIKFFRKDFTTMSMWLLIISAKLNGNKINIEDIARAIATINKVSKPSLRTFLERAKHRGYLKFIKNVDDHRSLNVEPEEIMIKEFKFWIKKFLKENEKINFQEFQ
jgi:hypothetical protein